MIKYKAKTWGKLIERIEVRRETKAFVFFENDRRESKKSQDMGYFDTYDQAKSFVVQKAEERMHNAKAFLRYAEDFVDKVKGLKE